MKMSSVGFACLLGIPMIFGTSAFGQTGGDQFLDGIGESALVARYPFSANERDTTPSENLSAERMRAILGAFKR